MKRIFRENDQDPHRYDDMLDLERPVSAKHPPMTLLARGAQFAPFAALTGYEDVIEDTARLNEDYFRALEEGIAAEEGYC